MADINDSYINVKSFGAKGDGVTDDTAAFLAARDEMKKRITTFAPSASYNGNAVLYIPAGSYLVKAGKALMDDSLGKTVFGYSVIGAGRMITRIIFDPPTANQYFFYNSNGWNQMHFADMEFYSSNPANSFMYSYSSGQTHNIEFERIHITGKWKYGVHLEGSNTNSEMTWYRCGWSGEWTKMLYIPAAKGSDQFVNYDFIACQFEVLKGDFIDVQKGGSINIYGGSFIYYPTTSTGNGGTFFKLGVGGGDHNAGAMRFLCMGARIELPHINAKMLESEWKSGAITFLNVDNSVQSYVADKNWVNVKFNSQGDAYPNILFENCLLQGRHEYDFTFTGYQYSENIAYQNCRIVQQDNANQFINEVNVSGFNNGSTPQISFRNCSGSGSTTLSKQTIFDTDLNWYVTTKGQSQKKIININTANNAMPYNKYPLEDIYLPLGAVITKVTIYMAPGTISNSYSGWSFKVRTSEVTPTVLVNATPVANNTKNGFNTQQDSIFFICDTDAKCHIVLEASQGVNEIKKGYCLVEYIG